MAAARRAHELKRVAWAIQGSLSSSRRTGPACGVPVAACRYADASVSARGMRHVEQSHAVSVTLAEIACVVGIDFGDHQKKGQRTSFRSIFRARPPTPWLEGHQVAMMATRRVCAVPSTTAATSRNYILNNNNAPGGSRYALGPPRPASRTAPTPSLDLLQPLQRQRHRPCSERSDS